MMKKYKIESKLIHNHQGLSYYHYAMTIVYFIIGIIVRNIFPLYFSGNTSLLVTVLILIAFTIVLLVQTKDKEGNKIYTNAILEYLKVAKNTISFAFMTAIIILILIFGMYYQDYFHGTSPIYIYLNITYKHIDVVLSFILNVLSSFLLITIFYEIIYRNGKTFAVKKSMNAISKHWYKRKCNGFLKNSIFGVVISFWTCYINGYLVANILVSLLPLIIYLIIFMIFNKTFLRTQNTVYIAMVYIFSNIAVFYII